MGKKQIDSILSNVGDMALKRRAKRVLEELELKNNDKILEIGCGDGFYLHLINNQGFKLQLFGIDNDPNALISARKNLPDGKVKLIESNAERLPFTKSFFDKIIMSEVIEHVSDDRKVLKETYRVLKPGGFLLLTTPHTDYPFFWDPVNWLLQHTFGLHIKEGFWAGIWNQHLRLYKREEIKDKLEKSGFKLDSIELLTLWCLPFNHYLVNFGARLLYGKKLSKDLSDDINKFGQSKNKKTHLANFLFWLVNTIDKLNDIFPNSSGVSIFIKATKGI